MSDIRTIADLKPDPRNANRGTQRGTGMIEDSLREFGAGRSILVDKHGRVIAGNKTLEGAASIGLEKVRLVQTDGTELVAVQRTDLDLDEPRTKRLGVVDNRSNQVSLDWDPVELAQMTGDGVDLSGLWDEQEWADLTAALNEPPATPPGEARQTLAERFLVPPFSVLDARQGYWQERKRAWIALGIRGEEGRDAGIVHNGTNRPPEQDGCWRRKGAAFTQTSEREIAMLARTGDNRPSGKRPGRCYGQDLAKGENPHFGVIGGSALPLNRQEGTAGTSVFDPVLCEVAYRWFCPQGGSVLDPFAGEATKGIVAAYLGFHYTGVELRQEQIAANEAQAAAIGVEPHWLQGDSSTVDAILPPAARFDLIFTSPPYYDLEVYSDRAEDGSAKQTYAEFMAFYWQVFEQAVQRLKPNRFLVVKVGEVRDKRGGYRNFVGDNMAGFLRLGLHYYNEAVLITPMGSLPVRAGKQFAASRKLGKTHQNVLVFYKGDLARIPAEFPQDIQYADLPSEEPAG